MAAERKFVAENVRRVLLKEYLMKEVSRAGFGGLDVQRTPMGTSVILATERPGLVIGRRGATIKNLTMVIEERFGFENPQIEVHEVENANLNAQIMAEKLAFSLERGWHFRRAGHSSVRRIMESGAKGCHIIISGKLTGQRHRTEKFKDGYIKFCGDPKIQFMERGYAVAKLKQGVVGVTVEIMAPGAKLPADITVLNKTDAAAVLPDLIKKAAASAVVDEEIDVPAEAPAKKPKKAEAEVPEEPAAEEKPKKAPAKKVVKKDDEEPAETPAEATEEKPKKAPAKKAAAKKADAEVPEEPAAEEKPKKVPAKKATKKAETETSDAPAEAAEEKPKKAVKKAAKKDEAEAAEPAAEEKPKKATAKKTTKKTDEPAEATEEKPKKAPAKKASAKKADAPAETAEKPKRTAKKKADTEEASE